MMSMIQKVSMGVSKPAATTNQYCISESLSIDVPREGYVDQTDGRNRVDAVIFYAQRPVSVLSSVTNTSDCFFFTVFDSEIGCVSGTRSIPLTKRLDHPALVAAVGPRDNRRSFRKFAARLSHRRRRCFQARSQHTVTQPRNRPNQQQGEPRTDPNGSVMIHKA